MIKLSNEQKNKVKNHFQSFNNYLKSDEFKKDQEDRLKRVSYYQDELPSKIDGLSELDIEEIIKNLYASRIWGNKQYLVQKIITENGIQKIQDEIKKLLDTSILPSKRYERALSEIKGLGPASITEMLTYIQPHECGIWNRKAREAIKILGIDNFVDPGKYKLSSEEYETFNEVMHTISIELKESNIQNVDLFDLDLIFVDFFLYTVCQGKQIIKIPKDPDTFDHDEIRDVTESIGSLLGFETDTEIPVAHGARVDVVWRARIGNLGIVTFVFEVHKSGSIDSLLLNLQKAKSNPTVQKVIAISDELQLEKIEKECEGLPEEFKRDLKFWQVKEVQKVAENLESTMEIINRLDLTPESF